MQTLNLLEETFGTIDDAQQIVNDFHWFLTIDQQPDRWVVRTGERVVFSSDSREAVDAFLYGMALAYKGLPAQLYAKLFAMMAGRDIIANPEDPLEMEFVEADDEHLDDFAFQNWQPSGQPDDSNDDSDQGNHEA
ncbi:MAG: hypothetical protein ACFE0Q_05215 [Anaerolineae bacterium]